MKSTDASEWWSKNGFVWGLNVRFERVFSSFPPCCQASRGVSRRFEHGGRNKQQKTRLQIYIDLLTLFPASDFLPLPKQQKDIIYFLGDGRFCNSAVWAWNTTAYLLTGPHLGSVTSPPAAQLWVFVSVSQRNERTTKEQRSPCDPLLAPQSRKLKSVHWSYNCIYPLLPPGGAKAQVAACTVDSPARKYLVG